MKMVTIMLTFAAVALTFLMATDQAFTGAAAFNLDTCIDQLIESGDLSIEEGQTQFTLNNKELMQLRNKCIK